MSDLPERLADGTALSLPEEQLTALREEVRSAGRSVHRDEHVRRRGEDPNIGRGRISDQWDRLPIRRRSRGDFLSR